MRVLAADMRAAHALAMTCEAFNEYVMAIYPAMLRVQLDKIRSPMIDESGHMYDWMTNPAVDLAKRLIDLTKDCKDKSMYHAFQRVIIRHKRPYLCISLTCKSIYTGTCTYHVAILKIRVGVMIIVLAWIDHAMGFSIRTVCRRGVLVADTEADAVLCMIQRVFPELVGIII